MQFSIATALRPTRTLKVALWRAIMLIGTCVTPDDATADQYNGRVYTTAGNGPYASGFWTYQPSPDTLIIAEVDATDGNRTAVYTGEPQFTGGNISYTTHGLRCSVWIVVFDLDHEGNVLGGIEYDAWVDKDYSSGKCSLEFDPSLRDSARIKGQAPDAWILKFGSDGYFYEWGEGPISFDVTLEPMGDVLPAHYSLTASDHEWGFVDHIVRGGRGRWASASGVAAGITLPSTGGVPTGGNRGLVLMGGYSSTSVWTGRQQ